MYESTQDIKTKNNTSLFRDTSLATNSRNPKIKKMCPSYPLTRIMAGTGHFRYLSKKLFKSRNMQLKYIYW